jgi:hypothetical protein
LPHFALNVDWPSISGDFVPDLSVGDLVPSGVEGTEGIAAGETGVEDGDGATGVFTTGALLPNLGVVSGAATADPELEDTGVDEDCGAIFFAQPQ